MNMDRSLLKKASEKGIITAEQAENLWSFFKEQGKDTPSFQFTHILSYMGGLITIGAMSVFMNMGWERFGPWGLFFIALAYGVCGLGATVYLVKKDMRIPAGITATLVVVLTPLAFYALQNALGLWTEKTVYHGFHEYISSSWIIMEVATLVCGSLMLLFFRLPFLVMPVAVTLWYMSMDFVPLLLGGIIDWEFRKFMSLLFGLVMIFLAVFVDLFSRQKKDYAFWLYFFGVTAFWGGLSLLDSKNELSRFLYLCTNLFMIIVGSILNRRVFVVFGGIGTAGYIGYLSWEVFRDSIMFPFVLSFTGLGVFGLSFVWQRHEKKIGARLRGFLSPSLQDIIGNRDRII